MPPCACASLPTSRRGLRTSRRRWGRTVRASGAFGKALAVENDEGMVGAGAQRSWMARQERLAGAGLADDQHGRPRRGDRRGQLQHLPEARVVADHAQLARPRSSTRGGAGGPPRRGPGFGTARPGLEAESDGRCVQRAQCLRHRGTQLGRRDRIPQHRQGPERRALPWHARDGGSRTAGSPAPGDACAACTRAAQRLEGPRDRRRPASSPHRHAPCRRTATRSFGASSISCASDLSIDVSSASAEGSGCTIKSRALLIRSFSQSNAPAWRHGIGASSLRKWVGLGLAASRTRREWRPACAGLPGLSPSSDRTPRDGGRTQPLRTVVLRNVYVMDATLSKNCNGPTIS